MRKFLLLLALICIASSANARLNGLDPFYGYYEDGKGQIEEYERIAPPHEEYIPTPRPTATTSPFDIYHEVNFKGRRRPDYKVPLIPDYNIWYHEHRLNPYSKEDFINVWCSGKKHVNGVDCVTDNYAITFTDVRYWALAVMKAPIKAKKVGKKAAVFCYVNEIGADSEYIEGAKKWSDVYNIPMFFGTIDSYLKL